MSAPSATSTVLLLKETKAVQLDALNYAAGDRATPLLTSVVERLQDIAFEATGEEMSFDQVVDAILTNI